MLNLSSPQSMQLILRNLSIPSPKFIFSQLKHRGQSFHNCEIKVLSNFLDTCPYPSFLIISWKLTTKANKLCFPNTDHVMLFREFSFCLFITYTHGKQDILNKLFLRDVYWENKSYGCLIQFFYFICIQLFTHNTQELLA